MGEIFSVIFTAIGGPVLLLIGLATIYYTFQFVGVDPGPVATLVIALTPIWLPFVVFNLAFERWMWFVEYKFSRYTGRVTLRIHLPQEVFKSPQAMEGVLTQIHNVQTPDNLMQTYLDGKHPLTFSLEIVSIGGEVRFYMNVPRRKSKNAVESQLYAYYPGVEVTEEELDYTAEIPWDPKKYEYMAFHMNKREDQIYSIKTYIDYELDKMPKEEEKFDPIAAMIEHLGKTKPHERLWIQFLIVPHTKKTFKSGSLFGSPDWTGQIDAKISEMLKRDERIDAEDEEKQIRAPMLTAGERDDIATLERHRGKYGYETFIRWIYITPKGKFDGDIISPTIKTFAQYDMIRRATIGARWRTDFDYMKISDPSGHKVQHLKRDELFNYKTRYIYHQDKAHGFDAPKVFTVEELATMFHLPGTAVVTPSLPRIQSNRKEAPSNLPTGLGTGI